MNQKIIFNYKQYVGLYPELLNDFLLKDIDYEEIDFLDFELRNYRAFYANTITDYKNDREYFDVESNVFIVDNCSYPIVSAVSEYANKFKGSYDNEGYDLLAFKFKKIIEFLEQKKHIIESKSPSKISDFMNYNDEFENVKLTQNNLSFAKEKIQFLIKSLIDFSNKNEYDFELYRAFALDCGKSFDYYLSQIDNETDKEKIISDLKANFHFSTRDIVTDLLAKNNTIGDNFEPGVTYYIAPPIPDTRIRDYENNYKHLIEYFFNATSIRKPELEKESGTVPNKNKFDKLLKSPDKTIFKDDFAFTLFETMKEIYSDTKTPQADYSFLCDIMQKEQLVICSGVDFKIFLSNYDINITKIDSARTGNKKKTIVYNSIKNNLLQKHGLSTV